MTGSWSFKNLCEELAIKRVKFNLQSCKKVPKDWGSKIIKIDFAFKDTFRSLICCADQNFLESFQHLECYLLLLPKRPHLALISEDEEEKIQLSFTRNLLSL